MNHGLLSRCAVAQKSLNNADLEAQSTSESEIGDLTSGPQTFLIEALISIKGHGP
jgi:hypothetical protein